MRKLPLIIAAIPLVLAVPALAGDRGGNDRCPPPQISHGYDSHSLSVHVRLPASGCPSRQESVFMVSAQVTRFDEDGPTGSVDRSAMCGSGEPACNLEVAFTHPPAEKVRYDIDVAWPGDHSSLRTVIVLSCTSDRRTSSCEE
jgi:hypothetical protein